ncbi:MAG: PD40 domain-containing protein, partial [Lewinella sp.]|nr:PD40 domain-containing protein [Lewinella sp.]
MILAWCVLLPQANAQYFGRNKPNYEEFPFRVVQSPHFELYHYLGDEAYVNRFLAQAEEWYAQHQSVLHDTIKALNPIILYANHPDFQQTNAISGSIGVGTGGVTEAFKNRVVLPIAMSEEQTHHVLGHEMVHAFQYNMILNGDSTSLQSLGNLPLWMVEGLAEYLSIGSTDAHTAMWMRDAVLHDDVPTLKDLNNPKYFPYRYGQMFWVFLTGLAGDDIIPIFFEETAKYGFDSACRRQLGMKSEDLSHLWVETLKNYYGEMIGDREENFVGREIINRENGGRINIAPEISPNGRYVIFLSERDVFTIDLFLAEARTGKIIRKVSSSARSSHIDDFNYIESSGTWSPNSDRFAYVGISGGNNVLLISETESGKIVMEAEIPGVPAFSNPAWSPDGRTIVVSGLVDGQTDLYAFDIRSRQVEKLTDDPYSELHPAWSDDGATLYFATDEISRRENRTPQGKLHFNLAALDIASRQITQYDVFPGADNLNPEEDINGHIVFLSNRDGYRNLYRLDPATGEVAQLTDLLTGVSGITHYAPAFSIDRRRNRLVYTYFSQQGYRIFWAQEDELLNKSVDPQAVDMSAAELPRVNPRAPRFVDSTLETLSVQPPLADTMTTTQIAYQPKFKLDYIAGGGGLGVGTNRTFGTTTGVAGGINAIFSDILGQNQLFASLAMNGEIIDVGGMVGYFNRKHRVHYGASLSHIPYRSFSGYEYEFLDTLDLGGGVATLVDRESIYETRFFEEQLSLFAQLPLTSTLRFEANASYALYSGRVDRRDYYYSPGTYYLQAQDRNKVDNLPGFNIGRAEIAFVGDNSFFGTTAPLSGRRFRLGVERYFDAYNFTGVTVDYRKYQYFRPVTAAFRVTHYGRYGGNSDQLFPQYLGYPWFVRGLGTNNGQQAFIASGRDLDELTGSKILVSSLELRLPFSGPQQLALIKSGFLLTDLNFFVDGGLAWTYNEQLSDPIYRLDGEGNPLINPTTGEPYVDYPKATP